MKNKGKKRSLNKNRLRKRNSLSHKKKKSRSKNRSKNRKPRRKTINKNKKGGAILPALGIGVVATAIAAAALIRVFV